MARAGIEHLADVSVDLLSLPERRLVEIARVIAAEPRLALLDEPTAGLDRAGCDVVADVIRQLNSSGCTVVIVEHNLPFARAVATDVVTLVDGRVLAHGPVDDVMSSQEFAAAYLGTAAHA